jgi:hypothetical protein
MPTPGEPIDPPPRAEEVLDLLNEADFNRPRTPPQVHLGGARGDSRPVVESPIARWLSRGAGQLCYQGIEGAIMQQGMTVRSHQGAVLVRMRQRNMTKRAQKFRRLRGLRSTKINEINHAKN